MSEPTIFSDTFLAMQSHCDVVLPNVNEDFAKLIFQFIKSEVQHFEAIFDGDNPDSPFFKICHSDVNKWIDVPNEIWDILTICRDFYEMSNGAFDVSIAPITQLWRHNEQVTEKEIQAALEISGFNNIEFNFANQQVKLSQKGMSFDFGAFQHGFVLDTLKPQLISKGVTDAIISFGEDAVLALGSHPTGDYWPMGIRNQINPMEFVHVFQATNETVVTSGTLQKPDVAEGISKSYIISPATGMPATDKKTVSVKAESAIMAEFVATCWLILPENDKNILAENLKGMEVLEVNYLENDIQTRLSILNENN